MRLWDFAIDHYARLGVADACLCLQDEHGQSVALLIWRLWSLDRTVDEAALAEAVAAAREWERTVLRPLRAVRRALKRSGSAIDPDVSEELRREIASLELKAERRLLEALEAPTSRLLAARAEPVAALRSAAEAWGSAAPTDLLWRFASLDPHGYSISS